MDAAVCSPAGLALWSQAMSHGRTSPMKGALSAEPKGPMGTRPCKHGSYDVLFAFAELCTYPTPCSLQNGRVGFIASLLLAAWPIGVGKSG